MHYAEVIGLEPLKNHLLTTLQNGRLPHAQLFVGQGVMPLVLAYAQTILSQNSAISIEHSALKVKKLIHPDLHFVFPVATNEQITKHPTSSHFIDAWKTFLLSNPYGDIFEWYQHIGIDKKQGLISVDEAQNMVKTLSLKAYEGGYKVMIIWMADKMNTPCANKILKLIEEPPQKTVFLLITEDQEQLLPTIISRCQRVQVPLLQEHQIAQALIKRESCPPDDAIDFAKQAQGNYNSALKFYKNHSDSLTFEQWTIQWVRTAFKAKGNKAVINDLFQWSENIAKKGREQQKNFIDYCISFFRQALLLNYGAPSLFFLKIKSPNFDFKKFAPFVHGGNILQIIEQLENAFYHIERNGNAKIIFTDLSIQLTRLLHKEQK